MLCCETTRPRRDGGPLTRWPGPRPGPRPGRRGGAAGALWNVRATRGARRGSDMESHGARPRGAATPNGHAPLAEWAGASLNETHEAIAYRR